MIAFVFLAILISYSMLVIGFYAQSYAITSIAGMAILFCGIYVLAYNVETINNLITLAIGIISVCFGFFVFVKSGLDQIEQ